MFSVWSDAPSNILKTNIVVHQPAVYEMCVHYKTTFYLLSRMFSEQSVCTNMCLHLHVVDHYTGNSLVRD